MRYCALSTTLAAALAWPVQAVEVAPPNWWAGMVSPTVELMIHEPGIAEASVKADYPGVKVLSSVRQDSNNYLFVTLDTEQAKPGVIPLTFTFSDRDPVTVNYQLQTREEGSSQREGFNQTDVIYLITPDRFANGDLSNDSVAGYVDKADRDDKGGRHGGDIQGMIDRLDYISDMGFTQVWTMPLLENAMDAYSYHGYSTTDYYRIDPRFGSNELYREFSQQAEQHGVGVIMDVILNHIGSGHQWMQDPPAEDWINNDGKFVPTSHRREALHDPHGVESDKVAFNDGWFVPTMPDLNQRNPHLAQYLIQNAIWWVEYAGLSGIRVDTYSYSDKAFLSDWTARLMQEYPNLNIVGEEWTVNPLITAYWQAGSQRHDDYESALPSVMDFPLQATLTEALKNSESWSSGLRTLYEILASDFVYGDPYNLVVFADNHDMSRIYSQLDEDPALWDMAMTTVLTMRGIPQVFYGTEILMANPGTEDHGIIRSDFPGGWPDDKINAFTGEGLTDQQVWAQDRIKSMLKLRQQYPQVFAGKLTHYTPDDGVYVYFRHTEHAGDAKVMVVLNKNAESKALPLARFSSMLTGYDNIRRLGESQQPLAQSLTLPASSATVWIIE
ncbi:glycoside hydrolase family 13 protein [Alteromonas sp. ASW11-19]|uniref:Glycoside hydrolase family 13 protein n=1 Tax=Alteromonas salexigens TaxID=2982530 RepID=A0ABT2VLP6_9ALTE|nr:glycoside hydrolase family 13 protein [Alteromonas salexigens]MCU7554242.1 glycoside hydrolase family 13 protein [Alteromonas salexigens]